ALSNFFTSIGTQSQTAFGMETTPCRLSGAGIPAEFSSGIPLRTIRVRNPSSALPEKGVVLFPCTTPQRPLRPAARDDIRFPTSRHAWKLVRAGRNKKSEDVHAIPSHPYSAKRSHASADAVAS